MGIGGGNTMSDDIFRQCLSQFARNFAYGDAVRHLFRKGYSIERIMRDFDYPYTKEELEQIKKDVEEENKF